MSSHLKVLWLSNKVQSDHDHGRTGTWLDAMAQALAQSGQVELANIAMGPVSRTTRQDCGKVAQWVIPSSPPGQWRNGLPSSIIVDNICRTVEGFAPDLVHVWGTETFWGLLKARNLFSFSALLDMQGLLGVYARVYSGGLTFEEQINCLGLKEIIRGSTISHTRKRFSRWWTYEQEIIRSHQFITTQSDWIKSWVVSINPRCQTFHNDLLLRPAFYSTDMWQPTDKPIVFCSAAYPVPYKGIHVALRAIGILKKRFPDVQLRIAGAHQKTGMRQDGYVAWLNRLIQTLGIEGNVVWLGALSATQIVAEMLLASAMVLPTFIENCSTAMQEAMAIGVPIAASYVGGLPSLARDEISALFFPPGDEAMCAFQLERLLLDRSLAARISQQSREIALIRNDPERIVKRQIDIYQSILSAEPKSSVHL